MPEGGSFVPHGHANICTGFIVLKGEWQGRHYDKVETEKEHSLIKPTIDPKFEAGEASTISDHNDNIHWFKAVSEIGYIFNIHVIGYDSAIRDTSGRVNLDPDGEEVKVGLISAPKMSYAECHKKYG